MESGRKRWSTTGVGTSSQVIDLESRRQRFSSGALDIAPYEIWSSLWASTDSEVLDLESGRQWRSSGALVAVPYRRLRWSTPGAGTSSQVIDLESRRERARRLNQRFIKLGFAILLGSTYAITSISVGDELSSRNRFISNCVLVINIVSFVSLTAANMTLSVVTPSSAPSTDTHTTQTANTTLSTLGLAAIIDSHRPPRPPSLAHRPGFNCSSVHICLNFFGSSSSYLIRYICIVLTRVNVFFFF